MSSKIKAFGYVFDPTAVDGQAPVHQRHGYGCSVACAAFVLNRRSDEDPTDYDAVLHALRSRRLGVVTRRRGVWAKDLASLLEALDRETRYRATHYPRGVSLGFSGALTGIQSRRHDRSTPTPMTTTTAAGS